MQPTLLTQPQPHPPPHTQHPAYAQLTYMSPHLDRACIFISSRTHAQTQLSECGHDCKPLVRGRNMKKKVVPGLVLLLIYRSPISKSVMKSESIVSMSPRGVALKKAALNNYLVTALDQG